MEAPIVITAEDVLLVIDVQNDFLPGGALAVADGDAIVPLIGRLACAFENVVVTQDWHPAGHASFASSHPGAKPLDCMELPYGNQVLWPDHCVQGSPGALLHFALDTDRAFAILRKGANAMVDSYSAFAEADGLTTGLAALLRARGIERVFACGLATDFCVAYSALDARAAGFETLVIDDACRGIDADGSLAAAWARMESVGVRKIEARDVLG
ncbi:MAG TPA: bifunctional nicotinamidase/pyrazinamidase [Roseiarcus sp.]|jgi:nicotinamidase/pyrazinamidase